MDEVKGTLKQTNIKLTDRHKERARKLSTIDLGYENISHYVRHFIDKTFKERDLKD